MVTATVAVGTSAVEVGVRGEVVEVVVGATVLVGEIELAVGGVVGRAGIDVALAGTEVRVGLRVKSVKVAVTRGGVVAVELIAVLCAATV